LKSIQRRLLKSREDFEIQRKLLKSKEDAKNYTKLKSVDFAKEVQKSLDFLAPFFPLAYNKNLQSLSKERYIFGEKSIYHSCRIFPLFRPD
jgi:hypothetical protein